MEGAIAPPPPSLATLLQIVRRRLNIKTLAPQTSKHHNLIIINIFGDITRSIQKVMPFLKLETHRRRRWGSRGALAPPGWCKVSKFRAKFWAISYILGDFIFLGQFCIKILGNFMSFVVWAILLTEMFRKPTQTKNFFFFKITLIWTKKPSQYQ